MSSHPYFDGELPLAFAHRGGAALFPENTREAFEGALALGFRHIETDVQLTKDGQIVLFHDLTVDRISDGRGRVDALRLDELRELDLGARFVDSAGRSSFAGKQVRVLTLQEALALSPELRLNLEMKVPMAKELWSFIEAERVHERVLVASAKERWVTAFRRLSQGSVATSAGFAGVLRFWMSARLGLKSMPFGFQALQVPMRYRGLSVVDAPFVRAAKARGIHVHVWTIDDEQTMHELLELGVDGIMSDRPDRLGKVLQEWRSQIS